MVPARSPVIDLVVFDPNNPRSIAFQVGRIEDHLAQLPGHSQDGRPAPAAREVARLSALLRSGLAETMPPAFPQRAVASLMRLSDDVSLAFFTHRAAREGEWDGLA
jgi:uncharacterized alpha-E superfamily protein